MLFSSNFRQPDEDLATPLFQLLRMRKLIWRSNVSMRRSSASWESSHASFGRCPHSLLNLSDTRRPPFGDLSEHVITYIRKKHRKYIVMWSDDSLDSVGGTAQDSYNFYASFADSRPDYPALTLSHETQDAGIQALRNGTVNVLADAGIRLLSMAQCVDMEPYEYVSGYQERNALWTCEGSWTPFNFSTVTRTLTSSTATRTVTRTTRIITETASSTSDVFTEPPIPEGTAPVEITSLTRWDVPSSTLSDLYITRTTFDPTPTPVWTTSTPSEVATEEPPLPEGTTPILISSSPDESF